MILDTVYNWLDLLWIPLSMVIVRKKQRIKSVLFILMCILSLRFQVELMEQIGFGHGFFSFIDMPALYRGYLTYGCFILFFLLLTRWSRERDMYVFMAAAITVYIVAFCVSTFVMVL